MAQWNMLYDMYERRLKAELSEANVPAHIGVILDGNRRWAKSLGATASQGHRAGAGKISEFLQWADDAGVSIVTLWLLSTDNLSRDASELGELLRIICEAVSLLADQERWKLALVGDLSLLPERVAEDLRASVARTEGTSPTPTSSSGHRENSASPDSCCGSPCTRNTTFARSTGPTFVASTFCAPCAPTRSGNAAWASRTARSRGLRAARVPREGSRPYGRP